MPAFLADGTVPEINSRFPEIEQEFAMNAARLSLAALGLLSAAALSTHEIARAEEKPAAAATKKVLRHVVFFKFKKDTSEEQLKNFTDAFVALPKKIDVIRDFEWGTDVGVEGLSKGFTHCFFVTFADAAGRDAYLPHPAHKEFVDLVKPHLEDVCVVDYWAK
jgi:hypothetical protein